VTRDVPLGTPATARRHPAPFASVSLFFLLYGKIGVYFLALMRLSRLIGDLGISGTFFCFLA